MSIQRKRLRKELHKPDELLTAVGRIIGFVEKNQKAVVSSLLGIIGISVLIAAGIYYYRTSISSGEHDLFYANQILNFESIDSDQIDRSIENFQKIVDGYSFSEIRIKAQMELGNLYFRQGNYEKAKFSYEDVVKTVSEESSYRGIAQLNLANSLYQMDKTNEALELLLELKDGEFLVSRAEVFFSIAQVYRKQGNSEKSLEYLKKISDLFPQFFRSVSLTEEKIEAYSKGDPNL